MKPRAAVLVLAGLLLIGPLAPKPAEACGGITAFIADDAKALGVRPATGPGGITFYYDREGNALWEVLGHEKAHPGFGSSFDTCRTSDRVSRCRL